MHLFRRLWQPRPANSVRDVIARIDDDLNTMITRGRFMGDHLSFGPNFVHSYLLRGPSGEFGVPGSVLDLGWSRNLKTTVGMDWLHETMGGKLGSITGTPATATSATSLTRTGSGWAVDAFKGMRVVCPVTGVGTSPVYGNIGSNSSTVLTIDQWWAGDDTLGTTPAATNGFAIVPGHQCARFMALSTNASAPAVGDTTLAGEITSGGLERALALFAHTGGATTFTLSKTFAATATHTNVHKGGLFTALTNAAAGILVASTVLNADATLASGDSIACTWTWTLPAAG